MHTRRRTSGVARRGSTLAVLLLALPPLGLAGEATAPPAAGRFLVATDRIRGSIFRESVVYLVKSDADGAVGLIVNHRTDVPLSEVVEGAADGSGTLHVGGPVERGSVMMLLRSEEEPGRAMRVDGDVFLSSDTELLLERTRAADPDRIRVYAGYAGWSPRQLEGEIARGQWLVVEAPVGAIFGGDPNGLWKELFLRNHRVVASLHPRW